MQNIGTNNTITKRKVVTIKQLFQISPLFARRWVSNRGPGLSSRMLWYCKQMGILCEADREHRMSDLEENFRQRVYACGRERD